MNNKDIQMKPIKPIHLGFSGVICLLIIIPLVGLLHSAVFDTAIVIILGSIGIILLILAILKQFRSYM